MFYYLMRIFPPLMTRVHDGPFVGSCSYVITFIIEAGRSDTPPCK